MNEIEYLNKVIADLTRRRDKLLKDQPLTLRQVLFSPEQSAAQRNAWKNGNAKVVASSVLKHYIQQWVDQGFTLVALALRSGVSEQTIGKIMRGETTWTYKTTAEKLLVSGLGLPQVYNEIDPMPDTPLTPDPPFSHYESD
jgi:hypothetical protein